MNEKLKIIVDGSGKTTVWMDGNVVNGISSIVFESNIYDSPTHTIEFISSKAGIQPKRQMSPDEIFATIKQINRTLGGNISC